MNRARWTEEEKANLTAHYPAISAKRLTELIHDRTAKAIKHQAGRMGIAKCHERRREAGRENVDVRWSSVFKKPEMPLQ